MRVLIDACLPVQLKDHVPVAEVTTAREMGWQAKSNGGLLALAQGQFDVILTMDKSIPSQQFLSRFSVALLIIRARSNRLPDLLPLVAEICRLLPHVRRGCATVVGA